MRAATYHQQGPAQSVLKVGTVETPEPSDGEVRVRLATSGVNPSDVKSRSGVFRRPMAFPTIIPHSDGAGIIDKVGPGVSEYRVGERVWTFNAQFQRPFGTAAEYVTLPSKQAVPLPAETDFAAGACLGIPALTAHRGVTLFGPVNGLNVLVQGGAGAVGHYAVQIAKSKGATVIATVSSDTKANHARTAGADHVINYRTENVAERVKALTERPWRRSHRRGGYRGQRAELRRHPGASRQSCGIWLRRSDSGNPGSAIHQHRANDPVLCRVSTRS